MTDKLKCKNCFSQQVIKTEWFLTPKNVGVLGDPVYHCTSCGVYGSIGESHEHFFEIISTGESEITPDTCVGIISPRTMHELAKSKGWYDGPERDVPELLCLIHCEISEALQEYRAHKDDWKNKVGEELADTVIRIFDMAEYLGIDIIKEIQIKHNYNKTRPYRHGNKKC